MSRSADPARGGERAGESAGGPPSSAAERAPSTIPSAVGSVNPGGPSNSTRLCPGCAKPIDALRAGHVAIYDGVFLYYCNATCKALHLRAIASHIGDDVPTLDPPAVAERLAALAATSAPPPPSTHPDTFRGTGAPVAANGAGEVNGITVDSKGDSPAPVGVARPVASPEVAAPTANGTHVALEPAPAVRSTEVVGATTASALLPSVGRGDP